MDHSAHEHHDHAEPPAAQGHPDTHAAHEHASYDHSAAGAHDHAAHDPAPNVPANSAGAPGQTGSDRTSHAHEAPEPASHPSAKSAGWSMAVSATLHCLTGCAIGEVLGMVIGTALGWHAAPTIILAIALAFFFGYALTMRSVLRNGLSFKAALKVALAADTISIAVMEILDNAFMLAIPGAMEAGLADARFWLSLAAALAIAFVLTVPVNRWLIARGKGHAVVHRHHH